MIGEDQASAAEAFDSLRMEVVLLRRAVEGLAAENSPPPDYGPTLDALIQDVQATGQIVQAIGQSPALGMSPYRLNKQLDNIRSLAAAQANQAWTIVNDRLQTHVDALSQIIGAANTQDHQLKQLLWVGLGSFILGALVCAAGFHLAR